MSRDDEYGCFTYSAIVFGIPLLGMLLSEKMAVYTIPTAVIIGIAWYLISKYRNTCSELNRVNDITNSQIRTINTLNDKLKEVRTDLKVKEDLLDKQIKKEITLKDVLKNASPFTFVSSLFADAELSIFKEEEFKLRYKDRPATKAAETVKYLSLKSREHITQYKEMLYKYEFLLKSFPELGKYVDDYEALKNISKCTSYSELEENVDRVSNFVSKEEWENMSVNSRNQLALDRYKEREKSNWVVGIEYEMYIDYILRRNGFSTIHFGIKEGLKDLGRDIIAKKNGKYYIIQCKNWSKKKEIHENVVCQLFGTTLEYKIEREEKMPYMEWDKRIFPVLYTTTSLSTTAMKFAEKLGVQVIVKEKGEYPMIKCNIGKNGEKIYHLPFDQQYYKTLIENDGEFYAWTVKEAVDAGFRRAFRYTAYNN